MTIPPVGPDRPTLYVMVGLPGAGKTTRARQLELQRPALRLTPDEWMLPLFGECEADGRRRVLEGRFVWLALRSLRMGLSVVLDFGVWTRDERSALRVLAAEAGADCRLVYLSVDPSEQRRRVEARFAGDPGSTFAIAAEELERFAGAFEAPDDDELTSSSIEEPPAGYAGWGAWAAQCWPTSAGPV